MRTAAIFTMLKKLRFTGILLVFSFSAYSQAYEKASLTIKIRPANYSLKFQFYSPAIVRVLKTPDSTSGEIKSLSVVALPAKTKVSVSETKDELYATTAALKIRVNKLTGQIAFMNAAGKLYMEEADRGTSFQAVKVAGKTDFELEQKFRIPSGDGIYGLGQHQQGILNYRNHSTILRQKNMEIAVPFLLSSSQFGIFWDNASSTTFTDEGGISAFKSASGKAADYYFIAGTSADSVIAGLRLLTGKAPMFPRWVFGFWQSRERYKSQQEIVDVVKRYRNLHVPLDGIVQDWQYWGEGDDVWNGINFGNPRYPQPKMMVDSIHKLNAHIIVSVWPNFGAKTLIFNELKEKNLLFNFKTWPEAPTVKVYDAFNPVARDIYWKYINKNLFSIGIDGWWLDATEPEQANPSQSDSAQTYLGSYKTLRNAYPLVTTGGVYEHQRATDPSKRVFILTRSAFAGQQRFGTMTWSGDIQGRWDVFRNQISGGLNLSLSGIPYWNTDIGGFYVWDKYSGGIKDPAFWELYTRWFEFAAFTPMFRSHGTNTPREIYQFGKKGDWAFDAQERFINLRYRLQPYIYSAAWQITASSSTMMRALVMDFPKDSVAINLTNEYMFGKAILVVPITDSMYVHEQSGKRKVDLSNAKTQSAYLPKGTSWIDFWNGESHKGGHTILVNAPIDQIPLFIKAGSILPLGPLEEYTGQHLANPLELRIYPGANGKFTLYEDENDNYNYEKGKYSTINFSWNNNTKTLTIDRRKGSYPGMLKARKFNVVLVKPATGIYGASDKASKVINYSGKQVKITL